MPAHDLYSLSSSTGVGSIVRAVFPSGDDKFQLSLDRKGAGFIREMVSTWSSSSLPSPEYAYLRNKVEKYRVYGLIFGMILVEYFRSNSRRTPKKSTKD